MEPARLGAPGTSRPGENDARGCGPWTPLELHAPDRKRFASPCGLYPTVPIEVIIGGSWSPYDDFSEAKTKVCRLADAANGKIRLLFARDVLLFPSATAGGAALMTAAPPGVTLTPAQKEKDEEFIKSISPAAGMKVTRLDIRVMGYSDQSQS